MSTRGKVVLIVGGVIVLAGFVSLGVSKRRQPAVDVKLERVARRDLVSIVTASGKIEPEQSVDILSDIMGRIVYLPLQEGNFVQRGQILVKLDTATYAAAVEQAQAGVASARANVAQAQANLDQAQRAYNRARDVRAQNAQLISEEALEQAQTAQAVAAANLDASQRAVEQAVASLRNARDQLSKTIIASPLSGQVTRLAVKLGEVAVPGTFSRETGLLMTVSDMSVIEARVNVDETDVVRIKLGDSAQVSIDAFPDTTFSGHVTKIANSSVAGASASTSGLVTAAQAVDFEVRVTLDHPPKGLRPDLSATANIITDTRKQALSVPIIALTVREPTADTTHPAPAGGTAVAQNAPRYQVSQDTSQAHRAKEAEGVFVVDTVTHVAHFTPVKVGIAGDEYFELLSGLKGGETIVAGSYAAIKDLKDGSRVKGQVPAAGARRAKAP
ncbi:MAG TPA: efflux RND transporter periplasmic adaptor subunit [Gemmatimonadales bacterium]|nr:efflux RND transporter periplasmic adaptor subunit [Gemmatimonadales bacterium]